MKVVIYYENGTEAKTLTEKQVELIRRAVIAFLNERDEAFTEQEGVPRNEDEHISQFREVLEIDDDITILESIRDLLTQKEVYEKAPVWRAIASNINPNA